MTNLDADAYVGRLALLRVHEGTIKKGQQVAWIRRDGTTESVRVTELYMTEGMTRVAADKAGPGDIIAIAGIPEITIGETIADLDAPSAAGHPRRRARAGHDDRDQHQPARRSVG